MFIRYAMEKNYLPRSRYSVTSTPRLQASTVAGITGDALKVGDCLVRKS